MSSADWSLPRLHIGGEPQGLISHLRRFRRSSHTRDLFVIAIGAVAVAAFFTVSVGASLIDHFAQSQALDFLDDRISTELRIAFLGTALGIVGWAYQAANTRFGVADLFAAEIVTICRVAAVANDEGDSFSPGFERLPLLVE